MIQFKTRHVSAAALNRTDEIDAEKGVQATEKSHVSHCEEESPWRETGKGKRSGHGLLLTPDRTPKLQ